MGNEVVDFSQSGRPTAAHLASRGYLGAMRYLSWEPNQKNITPAELAALHGAGLAVGFVWETTANRSTSGPAGGQRDVIEANRQLDVLGAPLSTVIYMATDQGPPGATPDKVRGYYQGAVASSKRPVGIYGGFDVVDAMLREGVVHFGWQTYAWSGGRVSKLIQLYQHQNGFNDGGSVDLNNIMAPNWGQWPAVAAPPPAPAPPPPAPYGMRNDMPTPAAVDMAVSPDGTRGYTLDSQGGLHPWGGAPDIKDGPYWPTSGPAIRVVMVSWDPKPAGYVLDVLGGKHAFGGTPEIPASADTAYWPNGFVPPAPVTSRPVPAGWGPRAQPGVLYPVT